MKFDDDFQSYFEQKSPFFTVFVDKNYTIVFFHPKVLYNIGQKMNSFDGYYSVFLIIKSNFWSIFTGFCHQIIHYKIGQKTMLFGVFFSKYKLKSLSVFSENKVHSIVVKKEKKIRPQIYSK